MLCFVFSSSFIVFQIYILACFSCNIALLHLVIVHCSLFFAQVLGFTHPCCGFTMTMLSFTSTNKRVNESESDSFSWLFKRSPLTKNLFYVKIVPLLMPNGASMLEVEFLEMSESHIWSSWWLKLRSDLTYYTTGQDSPVVLAQPFRNEINKLPIGSIPEFLRKKHLHI